MDKVVKYCNKCKSILPIEEFYSNKSKSDGLSTYCKKRTKEIQSGRYHNGEKQLESKPKVIPIDKAGELNLKVKTLKDYSPRELLCELKERGYIWEKMYVKQYVDYSNI